MSKFSHGRIRRSVDGVLLVVGNGNTGHTLDDIWYYIIISCLGQRSANCTMTSTLKRPFFPVCDTPACFQASTSLNTYGWVDQGVKEEVQIRHPRLPSTPQDIFPRETPGCLCTSPEFSHYAPHFWPPPRLLDCLHHTRPNNNQGDRATAREGVRAPQLAREEGGRG